MRRPRSHRPRWRLSPYPSFAAPARERDRDMPAIGERPPHAVRFLIVLMALPRQHDDVPFARHRERLLDRARAIELDRPRAAERFQSFDDVIGDRAWILASRIVAGDDHAIGEPSRRLAHRCALAAIAIAAAPEDADQLRA